MLRKGWVSKTCGAERTVSPLCIFQNQEPHYISPCSHFSGAVIFYCEIWNPSSSNCSFQPCDPPGTGYWILFGVNIHWHAWPKDACSQEEKFALVRPLSGNVQVAWVMNKRLESGSRCHHCLLSQVFLLGTLQYTKIGRFLQASCQLFTGGGLLQSHGSFFCFLFQQSHAVYELRRSQESKAHDLFVLSSLMQRVQLARRPQYFTLNITAS